MLSTSFEFRRKIAENSKTDLKATITFADGTVRELTGEDFALGGMTVESATSSGGSFDVGAAIVGTCDVTLANYDQRFDECDFTGATLVPHVGLELDDGSTEWLRLGTYNCEQPESYGATIGLMCHDNLSLMAKPYAEVATDYPATLATIVREACEACGLITLTDAFPNASYVVEDRPQEASTTCLGMVSYAAQVAGCFVTCDQYGRVWLRWYDTTAFESEAWLDGGSFDTDTAPYSDGDAADGGGFMDGGDAHDGGGFDEPRWAHLHAIRSLTVSTDDVVITGVTVRASNERLEDGTLGADGETVTFGTGGYVLSILDNPLVGYGRASQVAAQVGAAVVGMRFRPFDASGLASPAWQAGDPVIVTDAMQRTYRAWLTCYAWKAGGTATLSCDAATPARNSAMAAEAQTREIVEARNAIRAERAARAVAIETLSEELADSSGLYVTPVEQQDGSTIYYMHDKPTLAESMVVWRLTAEALAFSMDGGRTYPYGVDATGLAILNKIYAIGINASYLNAGRIAVGGTAASPLLLVDFETGQVLLRSADGNSYIDLLRNRIHISGDSTLGGNDKTVTQLLTDLANTVTNTAVQYCRSSSSTQAPAESDPGWDPTAPTWQEGYYIWQRTVVSKPSGNTYSEATCISGRDGTDGTSVTISSRSVTYAASSSGTTVPDASSFGANIPTVPQGGYLWTKTVVTYSDGISTTSYTVARQGQDGTSGTSPTVSSTTTTYKQTSDGTTVPTGDDWSVVPPTAVPGTYMWARTVVTYTDGATSTSYTVSRNGNEPTRIVPEYLLTEMDGSTEELTPDGTEEDWGEEQPAWEVGWYIWTRSRVTSADGTVTTTEPVLADAFNSLGEYAADIERKADDAGSAATVAQGTADSAQAAADAAQASADDAATKATRFIDSDPNVGILIGDMVGEVTQRMLRLTPDAIEFLNDGIVVTSLGDEITLGVESDYHMQTTSTAISFYEGANRRAYLSGDKLNVINVEAEDAFFIGNYTLRTEANGYFTISKRS